MKTLVSLKTVDVKKKGAVLRKHRSQYFLDGLAVIYQTKQEAGKACSKSKD